MSSTTTTVRARSRGYPSDYDVHHSDVPSVGSSPSQSETNDYRGTRNETNINPPDWPENYRRIPAYRPTDRSQDQTERRTATSTGEQIFLTMMFTGLETNVVGSFSILCFWRTPKLTTN
jgi:hypothetical protein